MNHRRFTNIKFVIVGLLCLIAVGCASFPGKEFPKYSYDQITIREPKPPIDYDATFLSLGRENARAVNIFQGEIEKIFSKSSVFSNFRAGTGKERYHFSLVLKNEGEIAAAMLSGFISGLTLTILPAYARDDHILTVDVKRENQLIKQYRYNHYLDTWIQLFLIFMTPTHAPLDVAKGVIDDMLLAFLHDLQKDNLLQEPFTTTGKL